MLRGVRVVVNEPGRAGGREQAGAQAKDARAGGYVRASKRAVWRARDGERAEYVYLVSTCRVYIQLYKKKGHDLKETTMADRRGKEHADARYTAMS